MSEPAAELKPFIVRGEDDVTYAAADLLENAVVLAGALYVASTAQSYRPHLVVIEVASGNVVAYIGKASEPPGIPVELPEHPAEEEA